MQYSQDDYIHGQGIDTIQGINDPMIDPAWIPYGWTQKYIDGRWIVSHPKASYVGGSVYTYDDLCRMYELGYRRVFNTFAKVAPECA